MSHSTLIKTREELHDYLRVAIQLEHATIPPYLTALYSIKMDESKTNFDGHSVIRTVMIEEMLHLSLAANILNAVGGKPDLTAPGFVPKYPTRLPTGQDDFFVGLEKYSEHAIETFLNIERPAEEPDPSEYDMKVQGVCLVCAEHAGENGENGGGSTCILPTVKMMTAEGKETHFHFHSIGEFYKAIEVGLETLSEELGEEVLFCGNPAKQVERKQFYSGGGELHKVTNLETAIQAIDLISGQGEGYGGGIYDSEGEIAHYYRFQQIKLGRFYKAGDEPGAPTGDKLEVYWDKVYPMVANPSVADYPEGSELRAAAIEFNEEYRKLLVGLTDAFNGQPELLQKGVGDMFKIARAAERLIHNPMPSGVENGAPTFEVDGNWKP